MKRLWESIEGIDTRKFIYAVPVIAFLHEFEEWNILEWHRRVNTGVPDVTDFHVRTVFVLVTIMYFVWTGISLVPKSRRTTYYILLPLLALGMENGIQHAIWLVQFSQYAPGVIFGFLVGVPVAIYIVYRIVKEKAVATWYLALFGCVVLAGTILTLLQGDEIDPAVRNVMLISKSLSTAVLGQ